MSTYEDYDEACHAYDNHRIAVGADVMAAVIQLHSGKALQELHVLDAGCGTGNYAKALLEIGIGRITLLDASTGMLQTAQEKLAKFSAQGRIEAVVDAIMPPIPFLDGCFDAVMFNVVLNHLDRDDRQFSNSVMTIKEARRVLRPNGVIVVSTVLSSATEKVVWFTQLNTELTKRFTASCVPSVDDYIRMFEAGGVKCIQKMNILGSDIYKRYYELDGPLHSSWRAGSSYWSFATES